MLLGFLMFFVGAVFIINGLSLLGRVDSKEAGGWNLAIAALMFSVVIYAVVKDAYGPATFWFAAQVLLFGFTYLFLGINSLAGYDSRGLGWYCLWVSLVTPYCAYQTFQAGDPRLGLIWLTWGALWFVFWIVLGLGKISILRPVAWAALLAGIFTAWIPGFLMLTSQW